MLGARHFELDRDLSGDASDPARGGRHPLPDVEDFRALLGRSGIEPRSYVVVYDDAGGANAAARVWWLLRALGHQRVGVLDGGLAGAREAGLPLSSEAPRIEPVEPYPARAFDGMPVVSATEVEVARQDARRRVVDVREAFRYRGEREPIDPIAGHIPGAINIPLRENLGPHGRFKSTTALRTLYTSALEDTPSDACVVHCGSGVTACHTLLALERAHLHGAALYVGSWSEWCRNPWPRT